MFSVIFPGQGSHAVGMAKEFYSKYDLFKKKFKEADEILNFPISKLILENSKLEIKPSMIQPLKEIKSLGKFKVKISLHSEVDAEITINVASAETIQ